MYYSYKRIIYPILTVLAVLAAWEVFVTTLRIPEFILPAPSRVALTLFTDNKKILAHTWITLGEIVLGFLGAAMLGILLAFLISSSAPFEQAIYPILVSSQAVPKLAVAPLLVIWLGFGMNTKVAIAVLIAFFPVVIDTVTGFRSISQEMVFLARSMGATSWQMFRHFTLPHAAPLIFSGLKVAITLAVSGAIVGEFVGADRGLGYLILLATGKMETDLVFAAILVLAVLGVLLFYVVVVLERLALPWHVSMKRTSEIHAAM
jgi:NitT/TauT family transport system permease protein